MNALVKILKEQVTSFPLILRLAAYGNKIKISNELFGRAVAVFKSTHPDAGLLVCFWDRDQKKH